MAQLAPGARARGRAQVAALGLLLLASAATLSAGYHHPDEYFQTVELAAHQLGLTRAAELPWEFPARIRPFLQPALYAGVARLLSWAGAPDPGAALLSFRLVGAAAAWAGACLLAAGLGRTLPDARGRTLLLAASLLAWWAPWLAVRTSSESLSGSALAIAIGAWLALDARPRRAALAAGFALGLAFDLRYQTALAAVGFAGWLLAVRRPGAVALAAFAGAFVAAVALGLAVDRWGYGAWTFTPWNYLRVNLLEGAALRYGRQPATFYLEALAGLRRDDPATPPLSALLVGAVVLFWVTAPRSPLTWTTVPFVVGHLLPAHKELRFLFPLGPLVAPMAPLLLLDPALRRAPLRACAARRGWLVRALVLLDLGFLVALLMVPPSVDLTVDVALRRRLSAAPGALVVLIRAEPFHADGMWRPLLRPRPYRPARARSWADVPALAAGAAPAAAPVAVVASVADPPDAALRARLDLRLVATAVPEAAARVLAGRVALDRAYALWEVGPAAALGR